MSSNAQNYDQSVYMLTDLLVDIGGISRAFVTVGLVIAHFAALHLYRAALIKDLFMV